MKVAAVVLLNAQSKDPLVVELIVSEPGAAVAKRSFNMSSAFRIFVLPACWSTTIRCPAISQVFVVVVSQAHIGIQHQLLVAACTSVKALPLVLSRHSVHRQLRTPTLQNDGLVIIVVELALIGGITPEPIEAARGNPGTSKRMSARDGSCQLPRIALPAINMVNEDALKSIASVSRSRHETNVPRALIHCFTAEFEIISEESHCGSRLENVGTVKVSRCPPHHGFCGDDKEICEGYCGAELAIHRLQIKILYTLLEPKVVSIVEVQAPVGPATVGRPAPEVHEVVAYQSDEASCVIGSDIVIVGYGIRQGVELIDDRDGDLVVVKVSETGSLIFGAT